MFAKAEVLYLYYIKHVFIYYTNIYIYLYFMYTFLTVF